MHTVQEGEKVVAELDRYVDIFLAFAVEPIGIQTRMFLALGCDGF